MPKDFLFKKKLTIGEEFSCFTFKPNIPFFQKPRKVLLAYYNLALTWNDCIMWICRDEHCLTFQIQRTKADAV